MVRAVQIAPHVTHVEEVDATELVLLKEAFKGSADKRGVKLTFLPFLIKAIVPALKEFPHLNSTLDDRTNEIVLKPKISFGIATDTDQGLVVPVVRDVERKDVFEISTEVERLAEKARTGQLALDEVHGSTITITNIGAIGGLFATPIINYPEVAIIGTYRISKRPVVREGVIQVRDMMYLSLTFDHRVVDGAYAARFMRRVVDTIQDPKKMVAEII
jgi:pyruvate dehydrogenase E2 component (dihydrolipoamide acetyltransferase)